jgi:hypothetical protein
MKKPKSSSDLLKKLSIYSIFILSILFSLSILTGVIDNPFTSRVEADDAIEIYSIEDLDAVRNDLTASYVLMNDLDFEDPASWEDYATNYDTIMRALSAGTLIEDEEFGYCDLETYQLATFQLVQLMILQ